jgi:hypothetical protein
MSWSNIHAGDYGWQAIIRIVQDGDAVNVSSYTTLTINFVKPSGATVSKTASFLTDGSDGDLAYTVESGLIAATEGGTWKAWPYLSKSGAELSGNAFSFEVAARGS